MNATELLITNPQMGRFGTMLVDRVPCRLDEGLRGKRLKTTLEYNLHTGAPKYCNIHPDYRHSAALPSELEYQGVHVDQAQSYADYNSACLIRPQDYHIIHRARRLESYARRIDYFCKTFIADGEPADPHLQAEYTLHNTPITMYRMIKEQDVDYPVGALIYWMSTKSDYMDKLTLEAARELNSAADFLERDGVERMQEECRRDDLFELQVTALDVTLLYGRNDDLQIEEQLYEDGLEKFWANLCDCGQAARNANFVACERIYSLL